MDAAFIKLGTGTTNVELLFFVHSGGNKLQKLEDALLETGETKSCCEVFIFIFGQK